jgi:hypothetical protein
MAGGYPSVAPGPGSGDQTTWRYPALGAGPRIPLTGAGRLVRTVQSGRAVADRCDRFVRDYRNHAPGQATLTRTGSRAATRQLAGRAQGFGARADKRRTSRLPRRLSSFPRPRFRPAAHLLLTSRDEGCAETSIDRQFRSRDVRRIKGRPYTWLRASPCGRREQDRFEPSSGKGPIARATLLLHTRGRCRSPVRPPVSPAGAAAARCCSTTSPSCAPLLAELTGAADVRVDIDDAALRRLELDSRVSSR